MRRPPPYQDGTPRSFGIAVQRVGFGVHGEEFKEWRVGFMNTVHGVGCRVFTVQAAGCIGCLRCRLQGSSICNPPSQFVAQT